MQVLTNEFKQHIKVSIMTTDHLKLLILKKYPNAKPYYYKQFNIWKIFTNEDTNMNKLIGEGITVREAYKNSYKIITRL